MSKARANDQSTRSVPGTSNVASWIAAGWVLLYTIWFYSFSLQIRGMSVTRWGVWLRLPELLWANFVPAPGVMSGSWANLPQRTDLMVVAAGIWFGAWAVGSLLRRALKIDEPLSALDRFVFACGLGISVISLTTLGCGLAGRLSPILCGVPLFMGVVAELSIRTRQYLRRQNRSIGPNETAIQDNVARPRVADRAERPVAYETGIAPVLAVLVFLPFLLAMILGSLLPAIDFDVKTYHLTGPKEFFLQGRITFLPHNVYTSFPFLTEMLSLLAMVLRQDWYRGALAGQAVLMGFAPLTALVLCSAVRRWFGKLAGWMAALIYFTTPWTYRLAVIAYVEEALGCFLLLTLYAVILAIEQLRSADTLRQRAAFRWFFLAGLFAGSAMACKYPGLVSVVLPLVAIGALAAGRAGSASPADSDRTSKWMPRIYRVSHALVAIGVGVTITVGPWLAKNWVETGNPVYPLAYQWFGGRDWDEVSDGKWRAAHRPPNYDPRKILDSLFDVTAGSSWQSPLLFGLAPLTVVWFFRRGVDTSRESFRSWQIICRLWLYVAYLFATWWLLTHRLDRFWVPVLPVVAWLAAIGATWTSNRVWTIARNVFVASTLLFNGVYITTSFCGMNYYLSDLDEVQVYTEKTAENIYYLNQHFLEGKIAAESKVLSVGESQVFDSRLPIIYNTAFDKSIFCDWITMPNQDGTANEPQLRSPADLHRLLKEHGVTHILVNWEGLLSTSAPCGFATPAHFRQWQQAGVLGDPTQFMEGLRYYEWLSDRERAELNSWAPELKEQLDGKTIFIAWQIFPVMP